MSVDRFWGRGFHPAIIAFAKSMFDQGNPFVLFDDCELLIERATLVRNPGLPSKIRDITGVRPSRLTEVDAATLQRCYQSALDSSLQDATGESGKLVNSDAQKKFEELVVNAITLNSSDIHIYLRHPMSVIAFRIDGKMNEKHNILLSYDACKRMLAATYNWSGARNSRKPFDVKSLQPSSFQIEVTMPGSDKKLLVAIRLETSPEYTQDAANGAAATPGFAHAVVRVSPNTTIRTLEELGIEPPVVDIMRGFMLRSKGMVLISGPTGSGKTTFLHGSLRYLPQTKMCFTIEDPVELVASYNPMIVQQSLLPGETYDSQLRSLMRSDPDAIMVGEVRDSETAKVAYRAALTGHLVLSTTHTGSAIGILMRLFDFGLSHGDLSRSGGLSLLVACRLVPKLCPHCKQQMQTNHRFAPQVIARLGSVRGVFTANPQGCSSCNGGTKGRSSVIEFIIMTKGVRDCVERGDLNAIEPLLRRQGWQSLQDKGWDLIQQGIVDPEDAEQAISDILINTSEEFIYGGSGTEIRELEVVA